MSPLPPCPDPFNLTRYVLSHTSDTPDKIALSVLSLNGSKRFSYSQLEHAVLGCAQGLLDRGLQAGDRLLFRLGNSVDFPIAFLGAIAVGIIPIPTSAQLTENETAKLFDIVQPMAVLHAQNIPCPDTNIQTLSLEELQKSYTGHRAEIILGDPNRPAYMLFTSGTSAHPRAVVHAHRAIWARQSMYRDWYNISANDRLMHAGAFNWSYTLGTGLLDPWINGATALIASEGTDISALPLLMKRHDVTLFAAAPGVYRKLLKIPFPALTKLRHALSAGEKLAEDTRSAWEQATATPLLEAYGMTECSTYISTRPDHPAPTGSIGQPQRGRHVAIIGEDSPTNEGMIAVHRDDMGLMLRYYDNPDATEQCFIGDWFMTGDLGRVDADGHITYLGRADDVMTAGGFRVSPQEIEEAFQSHPKIENCAACQIRVNKQASVIAVFYTSQSDISEADLTHHAETRLARYKQPRMYRRIDALPTGPNGKIQRRMLKNIYEAENGKA